MALATPSLINEVSSAATSSFAAQAAGGYLVAVVHRAAGGNNAIAASTAGWTEAVQTGPGDSVASQERVAWFVKPCDGTETSVTFTNMASGTRQITVFYVAAPGGGSWHVQSTKVSDNMAAVGLTTLDAADLTVRSDDCAVFAGYTPSSSYSANGAMPVWASLTGRGTANRFAGGHATSVPAARDTTVNLDATAPSETRRIAGAAFVLAYLIKPTPSISSPADEADFLSNEAIPVTATVAGGNAATTGVFVEHSVAGANTWTQSAQDTGSPYEFSIGPLAAGRYDLRAWWGGSGEFGFLQALNAGATIQVDVADPAPPPATTNIKEVHVNLGQGAGWQVVTAVHANDGDGTGWHQVWP